MPRWSRPSAATTSCWREGWRRTRTSTWTKRSVRDSTRPLRPCGWCVGVTDRYDVAVVVPALGRSGGLRVLAEWSRRLADSGRRVAVCTAARGPGESVLGQRVDVLAPGRLGHAADELQLRLTRPFVGQLADLSVYPRTARRRLPRAARYVLGFAPWSQALAIDGP